MREKLTRDPRIIEEMEEIKDKPHVIEEFFCGSDRQSLTVDLFQIISGPTCLCFCSYLSLGPYFYKLGPGFLLFPVLGYNYKKAKDKISCAGPIL